MNDLLARLNARLTGFFTLPPRPGLHPEIVRDFRRNFLANVGDMACWLFGMSFLSVNAILPVFASRLTDSPILIGLIPALTDACWFLPQLFMAPIVERQAVQRRLVLWGGALERLPFAVLPVLALWLATLPHTVAVLPLLGLIAWRALGSGIVGAPWQEMLAKLIPVTHRGRFFGTAFLVGQLLGLAGSALATLILAALPYPYNFAACFAVGNFGVWVSYLSLSRTREPAVPPPPQASAARLDAAYVRRLWGIWRGNHNLRRYLFSRWLSFFGNMGVGFLAVYAVQRHGLADSAAAVFTGIIFAAGVVGYGVWGPAGDRYGHKRVMLGATVLMLSALTLTLAVAAPWGAYVVFALVGLANAAGTVSDMNLALEFGPEAERPTYVGLTRTVTAPALLIAPAFGGWLAQSFGYPALFLTALVFAAAGGTVLALMVKDPRHTAK